MKKKNDMNTTHSQMQTGDHIIIFYKGYNYKIQVDK